MAIGLYMDAHIPKAITVGLLHDCGQREDEPEKDGESMKNRFVPKLPGCRLVLSLATITLSLSN